MGDAKMRSPVGSSALLGSSFAGVGTASGLEGLAGSGAFSSLLAGAGASLLACFAKSAAAEMSSPSSATTAMSEPTGMFFDPSGALKNS